jgi:hypothetical protein
VNLPEIHDQQNSDMVTRFSYQQRDTLIFAALVFMVLVLGYWRMVPAVCGAYHDDGIYVLTAKALAQGQGYRLTFLPNSPVQTKFPILYPALLAIIWKLWPSFPNNLFLMKWLTLVFGAATAGLSYLYLIRFRYFSRSVAGISALCCATSPMFLFFSTETLSEAPFACLVIVTLWFFETQLEKSDGRRFHQFLLGVLLVLPFLCRTVGVTLVFAGLVVQYYKGRPLRWMALGITVVMLPWVLWMVTGLGAWNHDPISGYYNDYLGWWASMGLTANIRFILYNILNVLIYSITIPFEGFTNILEPISFLGLLFFYIFLSLILFITLLKNLCTWRLLPLFIISYLCLILLWPWHPYRFLVPILPFLLGYLFNGINTSLKVRIARNWCLLIGLTLLIVPNFNLLYLHGKQANQQNCSRVYLFKNPPPWTAYQHIFQWLKTHSQPDDVIASPEAPMIFLYTGRHAIRPFKMNPGLGEDGAGSEIFGSAEDLYQALKAHHVKYIVKFPIFNFDQDFNDLIVKLQQKNPGSLKQVYSCNDQRFAIYEFTQIN